MCTKILVTLKGRPVCRQDNLYVSACYSKEMGWQDVVG